MSAPLGGFDIGDYQTSVYSVLIIAIALLAVAGVWFGLRFTRFGLIVRATMQNPAWPPPWACRRRAST